MQLSLQSFSTLVENMTTTAQGACAQLVDFTVGSVLRALLESSASVALWLQWLILQVLTMARLSTSVGPDADSWVADFGLARLPGTYAIGYVTLGALSPGSQSATVPVGATVLTSDGSLVFTVTQDTANAAWSASSNAYVRQAGVASITVPVACQTLGTIGNVTAGTVSLLGTALAGIDTCTNSNAMTGGIAAETDSALRTRFVAYINTRAQATEQAIAYAISTVQAGLSYVVSENVAQDGTSTPGRISIVVDDGSGNPPPALLAAVVAAVDLVRPIGSTVQISGPAILLANIAMQLTVDPGVTTQAAAVSAANAALTTYVNALPVGGTLRYSRLSGLAYDSGPGVLNVSGITLNGAGADLGGGATQVVRAGAISVS